jgi:uncharacterized protein DUF5995
MTLEQVLRAPAAARIADVVERMQALDAALPRTDGIACFNRLYLAVTEAVVDAARPGVFADPPFVRWLDVVFANLYFEALANHVRGRGRVPRAWRALFEVRSRRGILPIQFALAGMNAHINRDLPLALVSTCRSRRIEPRRGCPQHADFGRIDTLLAETEERVKTELSRGVVGVADEALGRLDDVLAMWNVRAARRAAWANAETLWALDGIPFVGARFVVTLDRTVGFAGRGLLRPVL